MVNSIEDLIINAFKENDVVVDNEKEDSYIMNLLSSFIEKNKLNINLKDFSDLEIRSAVSHIVKFKKYKVIALGDYLFYYKNYKKLGKYFENNFKFL